MPYPPVPRTLAPRFLVPSPPLPPSDDENDENDENKVIDILATMPVPEHYIYEIVDLTDSPGSTEIVDLTGSPGSTPYNAITLE